MNKTAAYLVLTLLLASAMPLSVHADQSKDIPTNASETGVHNSLLLLCNMRISLPHLVGQDHSRCSLRQIWLFTDAGINLNDFDTPEENQTLTEILLHHVVSASVPSADVKDGMMATTVNGDKVKFTVSNGAVSVGAAQVTTPDVLSSNGIIHVIDKVLMPPVDIPATAQTTGIHNSLVAAVIPSRPFAYTPRARSIHCLRTNRRAFTPDAGIDLASSTHLRASSN